MKKTSNLKLMEKLSLSTIMASVITTIIIFVAVLSVAIFTGLYKSSMEKRAITSSEQSVVQVQNMMQSYTDDMVDLMNKIKTSISLQESGRTDFFKNLMQIRTDLVAVTRYDKNGTLVSCYAGSNKLKEKIVRNLSYQKDIVGDKDIVFSSPHVESILNEYYPWVVTMYSQTKEDNTDDTDDTSSGENGLIAVDIHFSKIANYVDNVGIGQHGYCFIMDENGKIIYHPQQHLIYSGLKEENLDQIVGAEDGSYISSNRIYTVHTMEETNWRIVGVCFVDEMITSKVERMVRLVILLLVFLIIIALLCGLFFSSIVSKPANHLVNAMGEFEKEAEDFNFIPVTGTREIKSLSDSFGHMVLQIQELMNKVRQEEISLRKTELNALQAQINPHFLYNTLDSIAWMCEEERSQEAVIMVNALAKLFRISISKGHELITLEKEIEHAKSYLQIQKYRYKHQFDYVFEVEEDCLSYLCNKITLQPIIENAIYHGLCMVDEGSIRIQIFQDHEDIVMRVIDNGVGMEKDLCEEILHRETGDKGGIGIKNVHDRIRIYFGESYGLKIESELDEGTTVEIRIPKIREGEYDAK